VYFLSLDSYKLLFEPPKSLVPGEKLCVKCLTLIKKTYVQTLSVSGAPQNEFVEEDMEISDAEPKPSYSLNVTPQKDLSTKMVNSVLRQLDETPVKSGHMRESTKK